MARMKIGGNDDIRWWSTPEIQSSAPAIYEYDSAAGEFHLLHERLVFDTVKGFRKIHSKEDNIFVLLQHVGDFLQQIDEGSHCRASRMERILVA